MCIVFGTTIIPHLLVVCLSFLLSSVYSLVANLFLCGSVQSIAYLGRQVVVFCNDMQVYCFPCFLLYMVSKLILKC